MCDGGYTSSFYITTAESSDESLNEVQNSTEQQQLFVTCFVYWFSFSRSLLQDSTQAEGCSSGTSISSFRLDILEGSETERWT